MARLPERMRRPVTAAWRRHDAEVTRLLAESRMEWARREAEWLMRGADGAPLMEDVSGELDPDPVAEET